MKQEDKGPLGFSLRASVLGLSGPRTRSALELEKSTPEGQAIRALRGINAQQRQRGQPDMTLEQIKAKMKQPLQELHKELDDLLATSPRPEVRARAQQDKIRPVRPQVLGDKAPPPAQSPV